MCSDVELGFNSPDGVAIGILSGDDDVVLEGRSKAWDGEAKVALPVFSDISSRWVADTERIG